MNHDDAKRRLNLPWNLNFYSLSFTFSSSLFLLWHGWKPCKIQHEITYERRKYVNHINFKLNLSCRGWILCGVFFLCCCCFCSPPKIGLNIIKMMTPLRAYSCSTRQPTSIRVYRAVERAKSCTRCEKRSGWADWRWCWGRAKADP